MICCYIMEVKKILIPNKPHLDPIAAIYLLGQYGQEKFPGISDARIIFWEHSHSPTREELERFRSEGVLMIDLGGGLFDHHENRDDIKETATSLVASYLGIDKNPEVAALLDYIREDDLEGLHNRFGDLAYLVKNMYRQNIPINQVVKLALQILNFFQEGQREWYCDVRKEYESKCRLVRVKRHKRKIKVGIIESDNLQVANYGIRMDNLSVVIQGRSTGHVVILTNKLHRIDLREVVGLIRKRELEIGGYRKPIDIRRMQFEGRNTMVPNWFYHRALNSFLNGSDALNKTEPTKVGFEEIVDIVLRTLTKERIQ